MYSFRFSSTVSVPLKSNTQPSADSEGREWRLRVLPKALKVVVRFSQKIELRVLLVNTRKLVWSERVQLLVSCWHDVAGAKGMSAMCHGAALKTYCVRWMANGQDTSNSEMAGMSSQRAPC